MPVTATGHPQKAQLTDRLDYHGVGILALQRVGGERGQKNGWVRPVGAFEYTSLFQPLGPRVNCLTPIRLQKHTPGSIKQPGEFAGLGERPAFLQRHDGLVQFLHQLVEVDRRCLTGRLLFTQT